MTGNTLLLDCSEEIEQKLQRLGYNVQSGTVGFVNGKRNLPHQVYESGLIIYNPNRLFRTDLHRNISERDIEDETPEFSLDYLKDHFLRGATILVFANKLGDSVSDADQNTAYNWIPSMPRLEFTRDTQVVVQSAHYQYEKFVPLQNSEDLQKPVLLKLKKYTSDAEKDWETEDTYNFTIAPLFKNANREALGVIFKVFEGHLIVLPTYSSNDDAILTFLNRVLGSRSATGGSTLYDFESPDEKRAKLELEALAKRSEELEGQVQSGKENLEAQRRLKTQTIESDETAALIKSYYATAVQQKDVALFFLYKITEVIQNKYGSEAEAKQQLGGVNTEWNLIRRLANDSYGDMRHAPKPGEKIKEWEEGEIQEAYEAATKIAKAYFLKLF